MASGEQDQLNADLGSNDRDTVIRSLERFSVLLREGKANGSCLGPLSALLDSHDVELRRAASWSIGKLGQNKVVQEAPLDKLISLLADDDEEVIRDVAWALGELAGLGIGKEESIEPLNNLLVSKNVEIRSIAAWTLGRIAERLQLGHGSSVELLRNMENDQSPYARGAATWALDGLSRIELTGGRD
ncbi:MAG: HEAT repeat domain-containing protein [Methanomassiliicoccales archaeon]|jgi:HEAT repeat protein